MSKCIAFQFLLASALHAETIGPFNYTLPSEGGPWKAALEDKQEHVQSVIYTPEGADRAQSKRFFAVVATDRSSASSKEEDILAELKQNFPGFNVSVQILNRSEDQVTYSWLVTKDAFELGGITKGINIQPGTIIFTYQAFGPLNEEILSYWQSYFASIKKS